MTADGFRVFGHTFSDQVANWRGELETLEDEGATYENWVLDDEAGGPGVYRVRFRPAEIHQYVRSIVGWDEYLAGGYEAVSDRALAISARASAVERDGDNQADFPCAADFLGSDLEELLCGGRPERAERIRPEGAGLQASAVLHEISDSLPFALRNVAGSDAAIRYAINSELDFQNIVFLVLRSVFSDTRQEDWVPKLAGSAKRVDFAIPSAGMLVEAKFVRNRAHGRTVADELRVDFESYHAHPACENVFALVWDPERNIADPSLIERELSGSRTKGNSSFEVAVRVLSP